MKKLTFITGTTKGIGKLLAEELVRDNYQIVGFDRSLDGAEKNPWKTIACDLSNLQELNQAFNEAITEFGIPDALVNNAGIYKAQAWNLQSGEDFDLTFNINARAAFFFSKLFAESFIAANKKSGVIVNVASVSATIGSLDVAYAGSKAALLMITKSMAKALAPNGIRVLSVSPGPVETDMALNIPEDRRNSYMSAIPLKRFAESIEVVQVIKFLLSDAASYITGTDVKIDGGLV